MRFYSETKGKLSTSYEEKAYDRNVPNAILWMTKTRMATSYEALVGEDV